MHAFKTELCSEFLTHWQSFRVDNALPTLKDYLGKPHPSLQPHTVIKDVIEPRYLKVRLHGTRLVELSGIDLTGQNLLQYAGTPSFAERYWMFHRKAVDRPVGVSGTKHTVAASGRPVVMEDISLPVVPFPGGPPCIVGCVSPVEGLDYKDTVFKLLEYTSTSWIDIGWGVPAAERGLRAIA
jgi:hypothetical protein